MQAHVTDIEIPPDGIDAVAAAVDTQIVPALRDWPTFRGAYWFGDRAEGLVRAVVFFEAADASLASRDQNIHGQRGPVQSQGAGLRAVDGRITAVDEYEVAATVGPQVHPTAQSCRSIVWQEDPQQIEQAIQRIETGVIPGVRQNAGFQGGFWLVERMSGRCMGCTLWDTLEHLRTSGEVGRQMRREPIQRGEMQVLGLHEYAILARAEASGGRH